MADSWFDQLETNVGARGFETRNWATGSGRLLVVPVNARILGLQLPSVGENFFWHDPSLNAPAVGSRHGHPQGGDRLWIAPEAGYIFVNLDLVMTEPKKASELPAEMDPSDWRIIEDQPGSLRVGTEMQLVDQRNKQVISLRVSRQFSIIGPPPGLSHGIQCASFSIRNDLTLIHGHAGMVAGVWDLLQIPPGGEVICPTVTPVSNPRRYYEEWTDKHIRAHAHAVTCSIDGKKRLKFGLDSAQTTGRMGYYRKTGGVSTLIFRAFFTQPGEPYGDLPYTHTGPTGGDALQIYNDDGSNGGFGELEYHDPAIIVGKTTHTRSGQCITHVLAGPDPEIRAAGKMLLGVEV